MSHPKPLIDVERDEMGRAVKITVRAITGEAIDLTPLCKRVQTITTPQGTEHEVVLYDYLAAAPRLAKRT